MAKTHIPTLVAELQAAIKKATSARSLLTREESKLETLKEETDPSLSHRNTRRYIVAKGELELQPAKIEAAKERLTEAEAELQRLIENTMGDVQEFASAAAEKLICKIATLLAPYVRRGDLARELANRCDAVQEIYKWAELYGSTDDLVDVAEKLVAFFRDPKAIELGRERTAALGRPSGSGEA